MVWRLFCRSDSAGGAKLGWGFRSVHKAAAFPGDASGTSYAAGLSGNACRNLGSSECELNLLEIHFYACRSCRRLSQCCPASCAVCCIGRGSKKPTPWPEVMPRHPISLGRWSGCCSHLWRLTQTPSPHPPGQRAGSSGRRAEEGLDPCSRLLPGC